MAEALKTLSVTLVVCAVLEAVMPSIKSKRAFGVLCAAVALCVLVLPLKGLDLSALWPRTLFSARPADEEALQAQSDRALRIAGEAGFERAAAELLQAQGITAEVKAVCEQKEQAIVLKRLSVFGVAGEQRQTARRALSPLFGGERVQILFEEGSP